MSEWLLPALLAFAVLIAWARLAWWQWRSAARARAWRVALIASMQPVVATLLWFTLAPPTAPGRAGTLVVATAGTARVPVAGTIVTLPEAPAIPGAERVPDLATALRRHPVARLTIVGAGLEARDRDAVAGRALAFDPPADRRGLIRLDPPPPAAPGGSFRIAGQVARVPGGVVDLNDPAGERVDRQPLSARGDFAVSGTARVAGVALARIVVRDARGVIVEAADVPVRTSDDAQPRMLLLAGAAGPEVKYLRRWATDAGLAVTTRIAAGGGVVLGDAPVAIDAATLARTEVVVVDERSWGALGARERAALTGAVRGGMGLVVRVTGPVPGDVRAQWRALGLATGAASATARVIFDGEAPAITRRVVSPRPDAVAVWRDARGAVLADWRAVGRGRVALWTLDQGFALVLGGQAQRYGTAWGATLAAVARPLGKAQATIPSLSFAGERMTLCAIGDTARIAAPDNATLAIDPASACAGYWPRHGGWHSLVDRGATQPFYVYPADALPGLRAHDRAEATARLRKADSAATAPGADGRGASWPWFLAFLVAASAVWWFERSRLGRSVTPPRAASPDAFRA